MSVIKDAIVAVLDAEHIPWRVVPGGKHHKIVFTVNGKKLWHTVSCTPSDRRAPLNAAAMVRRQIRAARA